MACEGKVSDERITEVLITMGIEEELKDRPLEDVSSLTLDAVEVQNEQEKAVVKKIRAVVQKIGDKLKEDKEIQDDIKGIEKHFQQGEVEEANQMFKEMFKEMFRGGITWEKIVISLYVVGKVLGTIGIMTALYPYVKLILKWTLDFFKNALLGWILEQGGWICCSVLS
ncbi:apoptosis regulator BAX-like [Limanda limanda]|uniref:apoptosis regulator BAX-like n=1 Tax=Limanda limanda TaxID=27771 RepID=UPI0029C66A97|nr:apoptosis regulator BAX-like [Limanda limanda]